MKRITLFFIFLCVLCLTVPVSAETYTVAIDPNYPPFVYVDDDGSYAGLDVDLIRAIAADQGFEVTFVPVNFDLLLQGVADGTYDIGLGAVTKTPEREKIVAMSDPYYVSGQVTIINKEAALPDADVDLTQLRIGVKGRTVSEDLAREFSSGEIVVYHDLDGLLAGIRAQEVDAALVDKGVSDFFSADDCLVQVGDPLTMDDLVIISKPSDAMLYRMIDRGLESVKKSGLLAALLMSVYTF